MAMARTHNGRVDEQISKAVVFSKYRNEGVGESFSHAKGNVGNSGKRASVLSNTNPLLPGVPNFFSQFISTHLRNPSSQTLTRVFHNTSLQ
jgi:hypothetical protein